MKKAVATIYLSAVIFLCFAQDTLRVKHPDDGKIFTVVEKMPQFPGGESGLAQYLKANIRYSRDLAANGIGGKVYIVFVIDTSGKACDIKLLRGVHPSLDEEAIRVVKSMPAWTPGTQEGRKVKVQYNLPVNFTGNNSKSNYENGLDLYNQRKFEKAIDFFTKSINEHKEVAASYYTRGICEKETGNTGEACNDWKKAKDEGDARADAVLEKFCK